MSFKTFDYICDNKDCQEYNIKKEKLVKDKDKDTQQCDSCKEIMSRGFGVGAIKTGDFNGKLH
jgi:predicted SprT family Zn-dependent metalloprotease